jgi:3'(2'), 5'-bisphosphate nucleotidase
MPVRSYERELTVAVEAVRRASALCSQVQAQIAGSVLEKKDRSPVTVADFGSQAVVCNALYDGFPADHVVAEEASAALKEPGSERLLARVVDVVSAWHPGVDAATVCDWIDLGGADPSGGRFWTLDPIDGTKGFLRGEQYAVALALIEDGTVQVAVLGCPNLSVARNDARAGVLVAAIRGQGTRAMALSGEVGPLKVVASREADPRRARFCESVESGHTDHSEAATIASALGIVQPSVRLDSQAKYAVVARGEADIYMRLPTKPGYVEKIWDHAAGSLVVTEAGGRVSDIHGAELDFSRGRGLAANAGVIATNGKLHDRVIDAIAEAGVGR